MPDPVRARCPVCGKLAAAATAPFCSKRCADVDLGRWLGGAYRVPGTEAGGDGEQPGDGSGSRSA